MTLPTKDELHAKAVAGEEITQEYTSELSREESSEHGGTREQGGVAAMAQSLHDKQENLHAAEREVTAKPEEELTKEDASNLTSKESRAMDGIRPPKGSTSAHVQSVVDHKLQAQEDTNHA